MQVSPLTAHIQTHLNNPAANPIGGEGAPAPQSHAQARIPLQNTPEPTPTETVELSSAGMEADTLGLDSSPIFAEVWKNGLRIASIDAQGGVNNLSGALLSRFEGSGGPALAAQRAVQIALQVNGEIRTGGRILDGATVLMRERLSRAYGA